MYGGHKEEGTKLKLLLCGSFLTSGHKMSIITLGGTKGDYYISSAQMRHFYLVGGAKWKYN